MKASFGNESSNDNDINDICNNRILKELADELCIPLAIICRRILHEGRFARAR